MQQWIADGVPASQIAVLVVRDLEFYAAPLFAELTRRGIPFRNEQRLQDLSTEPAAGLVFDFLRVIATDSNPDAYARLAGMLVSASGDENRDYQEHMGWQRFLEAARMELGALGVQPGTVNLQRLIAAFLDRLGRERLVALSADYEHGPRLDDILVQAQAWLVETLTIVPDLALALERFGEDNAVRVMTIHKSKGLEFDTVVVLAVENQTFWANAAEERSSFFVAISRAKRRLLLTVAGRRARPEGFTRRWDEVRRPHSEFLGYAA